MGDPDGDRDTTPADEASETHGPIIIAACHGCARRSKARNWPKDSDGGQYQQS
jgi:hypothetical protein